ncbi:MAG: hypothetical protein Kow0068_18970 [Marinilabiliales bacterium]
MRDFVINISNYSHNIDTSFIIVPQNGQELITTNGENSGTLYYDYLSAIDGTGREDLFYGYQKDDKPTLDDQKKIFGSDFCKYVKQIMFRY